MAGIRLPPEESESTPQQQTRAAATESLVSDDDRSVAADSWSIKSEYGSTLDDEQRHADAAEALSVNFRAPSDYSSDKEEPDSDGVQSMLGLQSYWDAAYADELTNFREHGHAGEVWFGDDVMEIVASWTKDLCIEISKRNLPSSADDNKIEANEMGDKCLSRWNVLDIGTGNGLLLHELAKQGFSDLTGTDYSEGAIELAQRLAQREEAPNISFLVDDILETKLDRQFKLVIDKGTLDAIGLHPDGPLKRIMYWDSVSKLIAPGGILVVTSCNNTKDELVEEVENFNLRKANLSRDSTEASSNAEVAVKGDPPFEYISHVRTYPTFMFGGSVGSRVATVAFLRK